jgi:hypothetical protein
MDRGRSCYETDMVLRVGDPPVRVRWFFAEPGAKRLPYRHHFGSLNWERPVTDLSPGLGEVPDAPRAWYNGANFVGATGVGNAIPADKWFNGLDEGECFAGVACVPGFWELVRIGVAEQFRMMQEMRMGAAVDIGTAIVIELRTYRAIIVREPMGVIIEQHPPLGFPLMKALLKAGVIPGWRMIRQRALQAVPKVGVVPRPGRLGKPMLKPVVPFGGKNLGRVPGGLKRFAPQPGGVALPDDPMRPLLKVLAPQAGPAVLGDPMRPLLKEFFPLAGPLLTGVVGLAAVGGLGCVCVSPVVTVGAVREFAGSVLTSPAESDGGMIQVEPFVGLVAVVPAVSSGAAVQVEEYAGSVTVSPATSAGTYTEVAGGVTLSFTGAVTSGAATSSGAVVQQERFTGAVTSSSATSLGVYREFATSAGCGQFASVATKWTFTTTGITNNVCLNCSGYNLTETVGPNAGCVWIGTAFSLCGAMGTAKEWVLQYNAGSGVMELIAQNRAAIVIGRWAVAVASFHPLSDNTLPNTLTTTACSNWPSSITISPTR